MHAVHVASKDQAHLVIPFQRGKGRGLQAKTAGVVGVFHLGAEAAQGGGVKVVGPADLGRDEGDVGNVLVHDGVGGKLHQQGVDVFGSVFGIGREQQPLNVGVEHQVYKNRVGPAQDVLDLGLETACGVLRVGGGAFDHEPVDEAVADHREHQGKGEQAIQHQLELLEDGLLKDLFHGHTPFALVKSITQDWGREYGKSRCAT